MLTPEQQTEWSRLVERHRAYVKDDPYPNPSIQDTTILAVDLELTALRLRASGQQEVIDEYGKTVLRMRGETDTLTAQRNFARYDAQSRLETIAELRQQVEAQATQIEAFTVALSGASVAVIKGRTALAGAEEALKVAREALVRYATPRITTDYTGDEWERIDGPDTARHALATIDAALGKAESKGC